MSYIDSTKKMLTSTVLATSLSGCVSVSHMEQDEHFWVTPVQTFNSVGCTFPAMLVSVVPAMIADFSGADDEKVADILDVKICDRFNYTKDYVHPEDGTYGLYTTDSYRCRFDDPAMDSEDFQDGADLVSYLRSIPDCTVLQEETDSLESDASVPDEPDIPEETSTFSERGPEI